MYCQRCGVELCDTEEKCPLCGTAVYHPDIERDRGEPTYPADSYPKKNARKAIGLIVVTTLFVLSFLTCMLCDLQVFSRITWSGYVMGALLCSYTVLVFPYWFKKRESLIFIPIAFCAVGAYLWYIDRVLSGEWFFGFALPLCIGVGILVFSVVAFLRRFRDKGLYIFAGAFLILGGMMIPLEHSVNSTFGIERFFFWSLYPMLAFGILGIMLIVLGAYRPAREALERRFFL